MINMQGNLTKAAQDYSSNKADIGDAVCGGIATGLTVAAAIYTNSYLLYGAAAFFLYAEASALSNCWNCHKQQQKNTLQ
jgi:hypothetical protein